MEKELVQIKDWRNNNVLFETEVEGETKAIRFKLAIELAVSRNISLNCAKLNYAELNYAKLNCAKLNCAKLNYAELNYAKLNYAELNYAKLNYAKLNGAELNGANLNGANLNGAELNGANLNGANLNGANLNGAELNGANLNGANLNGAELNGANWDFSSFPLWCGSFNMKVSARLIFQLIAHIKRLKCNDEEAQEVLRILEPWKNKFCEYRDDVKEI